MNHWFQFKLRTMLLVAFALSPLCAVVYMNWPMPVQDESNTRSGRFVGVGAIFPDRSRYIGELLESHGIPCIIEGSIVFGISVKQKDADRAVQLIRIDAEKFGYWFEYKHKGETLSSGQNISGENKVPR